MIACIARLAGLALLLTSCATPPVAHIETVRVPVIVPTACLRADQVPARPAGLGDLPADAVQALDVALSRLIDWKVYGVAADGMLRTCSKIAADAAPSVAPPATLPKE